MLISVEPGIYIPGLGGFRHSDSILITDDGYIKLTKGPEELDDVMIRRMKTQVLKDLPPKIRTRIPIRIDNRKEYLKAKKNFLVWLEGKEGTKAARKASGAVELVKLGKLKTVKVGHALAKDVAVAFLAGAPPAPGDEFALLGMSFLEHFRLTIEDAKDQIILMAK